MTYCVGLKLDEGIVLLSDTRTNAGIDDIATYKKMFIFEEPNERIIAVLTAGNLSITQTTMSQVLEAIEYPTEDGLRSIEDIPTMLGVVKLFGEALATNANVLNEKFGETGENNSACFIVGGQRKGGEMRLFLVYPEGNFIEATADTPFLQIGETKYGKPILDRVISSNMSLDEGRKALLVSMDSTLRSNLSVGLPLDLLVIKKDDLGSDGYERIEKGDQKFKEMGDIWSKSLKDTFDKIII